ncbi:MAG TPA: DUF5985 family protein [Longimicrobiaceae bacterium]|nr:DUF5985 family protein [Longimicrobiaceae bacterium]
MAALVYVLCALTSLACAVLVLRGYLRTRARLLLWTGLCFTGLFLNNALLVLDAHTPSMDLSVWRSLPAVAGLAVLIYGLVWEAGE